MLGRVSAAGAAVTVIAGLSNLAFYVKNNQVAHFEQVPRAGEGDLNSKLLEELANSGVKYNPEDIVAITKTADGKLVWLENGTDTAGLKHIII